MKKIFGILLASALLCSCATAPETKTSATTAPDAMAYAYPIENPYAATIIGTPAELRQPYNNVPDTKERKLVVFKDRKVPEGFWYEDGLKYGELLQTHAAPLVYIIAGTGADYHSEAMRTLGAAFYTSGFHVILLPSTTHTNFIVTASSNFIPGRPSESAKDLYRVMKMIDARVAKETTITNRYLTGYSLGGIDAAFTAKLDDEQKSLNFRKVLLINPPLNLYSSIQKIDKMLYSGLPGGMNGVDKFIDTELARLATASQSGDALDFQNARLLIDAYTKYPPSDERLATTIGLAFRLFAADMMFTSDVMAHTGYIFPKNVEFTTGTSLNNYMSVSLRTSLKSYFNDVYAKKYMGDNPNLTQETLVRESGLESIAPYLSSNPKIGLVTNKDDIILSEGELQTLENIFGNKAKIFPNGGHLGNLSYPPVTTYIVRYLQSGEQQ